MLPTWTRPDTGLVCLTYQRPGGPTAPKLSVLMPVYNGAGFLNQAVASILDQTFAGFELVVVDDGSVDTTPNLLHRWAEKDPRVRVIRQPHLGLIEALNTGWLACRTPIIARMDADDLSAPTRLEKQIKLLDDRPEVGVVTCAATLIDDAGQTLGTTGSWDPSQGLVAFLAGNPIVHGSVMIRRAVVAREPPYTRAPEDYRLWIELLAQGVKFAHIDEPLYKFRAHSGRYSIWSARSQLRGVMEVQLDLLRHLSGKPNVPHDLVAAAWESVAVAAHANGETRLASHAHRQSERYSRKAATASGYLDRAIEAYGWGQMPWHWYQAKAVRLLRSRPGYATFRKVLLNHPLVARLAGGLAWLRHRARRAPSPPKGAARTSAGRKLPAPRVLHGARVLVIGKPDSRTWSRIVQAGPAEVTVTGPPPEFDPPPDCYSPIPVRATPTPSDTSRFDVVIRISGGEDSR